MSFAPRCAECGTTDLLDGTRHRHEEWVIVFCADHPISANRLRRLYGWAFPEIRRLVDELEYRYSIVIPEEA